MQSQCNLYKIESLNWRGQKIAIVFGGRVLTTSLNSNANDDDDEEGGKNSFIMSPCRELSEVWSEREEIPQAFSAHNLAMKRTREM